MYYTHDRRPFSVEVKKQIFQWDLTIRVIFCFIACKHK